MKRIVRAALAAAGVAACSVPVFVLLPPKSVAPRAPIVAPAAPIVARRAPVIAPPPGPRKIAPPAPIAAIPLPRPRPPLKELHRVRTPPHRKAAHRRARVEREPAGPPLNCPLTRFAVAHFPQGAIGALEKLNAVTPAQERAGRKCLHRKR